MSRGTDRLIKSVKQFADLQYKLFTARYGQQLIDIFEFPIKLVLSPFTLAFDIVGSAPRGFGVPELVSKLSYASIFAVATLGTYDIALEMGKKVICQRNCQTCNGWQALRCHMCKGAGKVQYQVKNYTLRSGEKATAECIADAIADNRAELVHLPSSMDLNVPLPSKDCPTCDGTGVMSCPECKNILQVRISADDIMEPPWQAYNVLSKMEYPYEEYTDLVTADVPSAALATIQNLHANSSRDQFLMKLRSEFESVRSSLLNRSPVPSLDICFGELLREEQRLSTQAILEHSHGIPGTTIMAYAAHSQGPSMYSKKLQCFCCKEYGHIAANCPKKFCSYCKKKGHIIKECRIRPQNRQARALQTSVTIPPVSRSDAHVFSSGAYSAPAPSAGNYCTPEMVQQMLISALSAMGIQGLGNGEADREGT